MQSDHGHQQNQGHQNNNIQSNNNMSKFYIFKLVQMNNLNLRLINDPLVELANAGSAIIKQKIELLEILTGCETANRYHVYIKTTNGEMTYLFKCKEESGCCERQCLT
jgi:hypothetical protein